MKLTAENARIGQIWRTEAGTEFRIADVYAGKFAWSAIRDDEYAEDVPFDQATATWRLGCTLVFDVGDDGARCAVCGEGAECLGADGETEVCRVHAEPWIDHRVSLPVGYEWAKRGEALGEGAEQNQDGRWRGILGVDDPAWNTPEKFHAHYFGERLIAVRRREEAVVLIDVPMPAPDSPEARTVVDAVDGWQPSGSVTGRPHVTRDKRGVDESLSAAHDHFRFKLVGPKNWVLSSFEDRDTRRRILDVHHVKPLSERERDARRLAGWHVETTDGRLAVDTQHEDFV